MRTLAIFGMALLSAAAFLGTGTGCGGSDSTTTSKGGSKNTGGSKTGGSTKSNVGGSDTDQTTDDTSGDTGGSSASGKGGSSASSSGSSKGGSTTQSSSATPTGGESIPLNEDGSYSSGGYKGYLWTAKDKPTEDGEGDGSSISPPCGDAECFTDKICVTGTVAKIPNLPSTGKPDYEGVWGVSVGWNLDPDDSGNVAVDVSSKTKITVGLSGTVPTASLRLQVEVPDSGNTYCSTLTLPGGVGTVNLTDLKTKCWQTTDNEVFDPATMKPKNISVQIVAKTAGTQDFDFCVSKLDIE